MYFFIMWINKIWLQELNELINKRNPTLVRRKLEELFWQKIEKDTNLDKLFREKIFSFLLVNLLVSQEDFQPFNDEEKQEYIEWEIESLKQQLKNKEQEVNEFKKLAISEKSDEARKMFASAIREKNKIKEKLENIRLSLEIFNKLELVKQELISIFETRKTETKTRIIKPVETKKEIKQVKMKDTTKIEKLKKEKKISLKDFENVLEEWEQEVKGFLGKNYDRFSDNDKVVICQKLLNNKYSIEYVESLFEKIKVSKLTKTFSNKWMDIDWKIEEIKKGRRKKELLKLEENEIKAKLDNLWIEYVDGLGKKQLVKLLLKNEWGSNHQKNKKTVKTKEKLLKEKSIPKIKLVLDDNELIPIEHMVKEVVEQLIPEPEEVKEEIILEPIEEEKPVSELDIEKNKQEDTEENIEEVEKLFDKYMKWKLRWKWSKEKIEKLLSETNIEMLITIILKDLNLFFQKRWYYFKLS